MILINLLPHREKARKQARQVFNASLVAAALLGVVISAAVYLWFQGQIAGQQERNVLLTSEIKKLEEEIKEIKGLQEEIAALKARQQAVEDLQADRNLPVHLLNESVQLLPDGVYLRSIKQENQFVLFTGAAQSNERVSELLRNMSRSTVWITKPELIEIVAGVVPLSPREQRRVYNFTVRALLQRPGEPGSDVTKPSSDAPASPAVKS